MKTTRTATKTIIAALVALGLGHAVAHANLVTTSAVWQAPLDTQRAKPYAVAFEARNNRLWTANFGNNTVSVREANSGRVVRVLSTGRCPMSVIVDDARHQVFVVNSASKSVECFDTDSFRLIKTIAVGRNPQIGALDAHTGRLWVANCDDATVSVIAADLNSVQTLRSGKGACDVAVDAKNRRVYVANSLAASVKVFDADSKTPVNTIALDADPFSLALDSESGALFVSHCDTGNLSFLPEPATGKAFSIRVGGNPLGLAIDAARGRVYVADYDNQKLQLLDTAGHVLEACEVGDSPLGITFDPKTGRVWVAGVADNTLDVVDLQNTTRPQLCLADLMPPAPKAVLVAAPLAPAVSQPAPLAINCGSQLSASKPVIIKDAPAPFTQVFDEDPIANLPAPPAARRSRQTLAQKPLFDEVSAGQIGQRIASEAWKLQTSGASANYVHQCDRLADTAILAATRRFNGLVGPQPGGDSAAQTMHRFQKAGFGFAFAEGTQLRAGDLLYAGENVGGGYGHAMIVGPTGLICDQYGAKTKPTVKPQWVVRADDVFGNSKLSVRSVAKVTKVVAPVGKVPTFPKMPGFPKR